ncbi:SH protein [Puerto Almendras virus]|uniref:SH protein n=1 Tax=Puerto Almendras virus TaxID=1479613 RepID=X4QGQ6_9RHAB|nr:SH protein [Puerto Almendras virus]AHU86505.1 SH protein [Puerto Almendras virus]
MNDKSDSNNNNTLLILEIIEFILIILIICMMIYLWYQSRRQSNKLCTKVNMVYNVIENLEKYIMTKCNSSLDSRTVSKWV